jgi:hypothetical protein
MMTEQQLFHLEHEIQGWHAQQARRGTPQPEHAQHRFENLRQLWQRWTASGEPAALKALRLELLRAVARGEISPETAHRVLSAR